MKTILILTDFSESSTHAAEYALYVAMDVRAKVILYNSYYVQQAAPVESGMFQTYYGDYEVYANDSMANLKAQAEALRSKFALIGIYNLPEIECKNDIGLIGDNISKLLDRDKIWMIVMGDKHNDSFLSRFVFGSDSKQIIEQASCPLMIIPQEASPAAFKRIVLAYPSLEPENLKCVEFLVELAEPFNADIEIVHVFENGSKWQDEQQYPRYFKSVKENLRYEKLAYRKIREEDIPGAIERFAEAIDSSLIGLIYKKYSFFKRIFHKSVVESVMNYHKFPLLVFPDAYTDSEGDG